MLVVVVLSASELVAEDAVVAVAFVVLWPVVAVACCSGFFGQAGVAVSVVGWCLVLVVVHVLFSSPGLLHQVLSTDCSLQHL